MRLGAVKTGLREQDVFPRRFVLDLPHGLVDGRRLAAVHGDGGYRAIPVVLALEVDCTS
jgi:hypothetical protein